MARATPKRFGIPANEFRGMLIIFLAGLIALAILGIPEAHRPFASVETGFTDSSIAGLQIVPASCPSNPHTFGECSGGGGMPPPTCTAGFFCVGNQRYYRNASCAQSYVEFCAYGCVNGYCLERPECPEGGTSCNTQCIPQYYCFGNDLYFRDSQCGEGFIQTCYYGCDSGACNVAPAGALDIRVSPSLVRQGESTTVTWTSSGMVSCVVSEDAPGLNDRWTTLNGTQLSGPITQQTTYTLSCLDEDDDVFTDTARVNILPVWEEE